MSATTDALNGLRLSSDIDEARTQAIAVIETWEFKKKKQFYINKVNELTSVDKITQLLWQTAMSGDGNAVIK